MQTILQAILDVTGVGAALVFDGDGRLVCHSSHAVYDQTLCEQLSNFLLKVVDTVQLEQEDWESVSARYDNGRLLLRNLGATGSGTHVLAVAADATLNHSFATVAIRVAANKLKRVLGGGAASSVLAAASSSLASSSLASSSLASSSLASSSLASSSLASSSLASSSLASSSPVASSPVASSPVASSPVASSPVASSLVASSLPASSIPADSRAALAGSSSLSRPQTSSVGLAHIAVADSASSTFLFRSAKEIARYLGPKAEVCVEEAVHRVSPDAPFSLGLGAKLLDDLAGQIDDGDDRKRFRQTLALVMQVPPADHPKWIELVTGKMPFRPSFLLARMFLASARTEVGRSGANPKLIQQYAAKLHELFVENTDSANVRQDLARLKIKISLGEETDLNPMGS
jgi:predicted regulator of Ras-like GTPase activity (Roadblock/LC7/MglB family)